MQNSAGIISNIILTITWAVCLGKVFSSKFSPFVLCPDPLILQNTEGKAKSQMDEYNSHYVWVCFCPQLIASSPFSSSTFPSTKKICWSFTSAVIMRRLSSKTLTCSRSAVDGRRRQGHISHKWLWLQGFPSPAWTAATGWHKKVKTRWPMLARTDNRTEEYKKKRYNYPSCKSNVQIPLLENLPTDPGVLTSLCWLQVNCDESLNSSGTQIYPENRRSSPALWTEKMSQHLHCKREVNTVQTMIWLSGGRSLICWFIPRPPLNLWFSLNSELYCASIPFFACLSL